MTAPTDRDARPTRRALLTTAAAGTALAALPRALRAGALRPAPRRTLILVWLDGGMSHLDTFDAKPEAPTSIRGDLATIRGAVDGTFLGAALPKLAARLDRCALVRSLSHGDGNHDRGSCALLTGHRPSAVLAYPSIGAVATARRPVDGALPDHVAIPDLPAYGGRGYLAAEHDAFEVGGDPGRPGFRVRDLEPPRDAARTAELTGLLDALDGPPRSADERARDAVVRRAAALGGEASSRETFDLDREPAATRDRYGRSTLGQSLLLARRLAAAGVGSILVRDTGWDHHQGIARALTFGYPPKLQALDDGLAALLDDLRDDALAGRVTLCVASEFGRTPRLNPAGGRDHWPRAQSVLLAGAGIAPGVVFGSTDPRGEEPASDPVGPGDLFATLCAALGVATRTPFVTADGRPVPVLPDGARAIREVLA